MPPGNAPLPFTQRSRNTLDIVFTRESTNSCKLIWELLYQVISGPDGLGCCGDCSRLDLCCCVGSRCRTCRFCARKMEDGTPGSDHPCRQPHGLGILHYLQKTNGELCLCLDPCDLNEAICQDHHKIPTVEEVACEFVHSHYFTKLDAHHGYWSIILNQESSLFTTFNSPFGRYLFL